MQNLLRRCADASVCPVEGCGLVEPWNDDAPAVRTAPEAEGWAVRGGRLLWTRLRSGLDLRASAASVLYVSHRRRILT